MAVSTYEFAINRIIKNYEGGYVNHPNDPGGETNLGVTVAVARAHGYTGPMRELPLSVAHEIYRDKYAKPVLYDQLEPGKDFSMLDYGINSGPARPIRVAQAICGCQQTGKMDAATLKAINEYDSEEFINKINDERLIFMKSLKNGAMWQTFGKGWGARVADTRKISMNIYANERKGKLDTEALPPAKTDPKTPTPKVEHKPNPKVVKTGSGAIVVGTGTGGTGGATAQGATMWGLLVAGVMLALIATAALLLYFRHIKKKNELVVLPTEIRHGRLV